MTRPRAHIRRAPGKQKAPIWWQGAADWPRQPSPPTARQATRRAPYKSGWRGAFTLASFRARPGWTLLFPIDRRDVSRAGQDGRICGPANLISSPIIQILPKVDGGVRRRVTSSEGACETAAAPGRVSRPRVWPSNCSLSSAGASRQLRCRCRSRRRRRRRARLEGS